jgi:hypothetical protein
MEDVIRSLQSLRGNFYVNSAVKMHSLKKRPKFFLVVLSLIISTKCLESVNPR